MFKKTIIFIFTSMFIIFGCSDVVKFGELPKFSDYDTYKIFGGMHNYGDKAIWYSSGEYIVFVYSGINTYYSAICKIDPDGKNFEILYEPTEYKDFHISGISGDGYILFDESGISMNESDIYYYKPYEEPIKTSIKGIFPTIFGNLSGKYNIAYLYEDNDKTDEYSIYVSDINGSKPKKLIGEGYLYYPCWSTDGKKLVYIKEENDTDNLCIYDIESNNESILYHHGGIKCPKFSPDCNYIAFSAQIEKPIDQHGVCLINASGGDPWQITQYPYDPGRETPGVCYLSWSHDGKWIVYDIGPEGELWKVRVFE